MNRRRLTAAFFARDADVVARDLVGRGLVVAQNDAEPAVCRIVETEAYFGAPGANPQLADRIDMPVRLRRALVRDGDAASHSFRGRTPRNTVMHGPPAHAYLIYGMHECLNVSTGDDGRPQAVLLRAAEPVVPATSARMDGPGRLTRALGVTRALDGLPMTQPGFGFIAGEPAERVRVTPRINVTGADGYRLRFFDAKSRHVSGPRALRPQ